MCPLCPVERVPSFRLKKDYLRHVELFHAHQPNFCIPCGISGCQRTFQKLHTFRKHISDHHSGDPSPTNQPLATQPEPDDCSITASDQNREQDTFHHGHAEPHTAMSALQKSSALFLMGLKEERKLTQTALQGVIEGVTTLTRSQLSVLHAEVSSVLSEAGVLPSSVPGLDELFDSDGQFGRPFSGLETPHQQLTFCKTHFNLIVSCFVMSDYLPSLLLSFVPLCGLSGTSEHSSW